LYCSGRNFYRTLQKFMKKDKMAQTENKEELTISEIAEESSYEGESEIKRRVLRGDETEGDADDRDVVGSVKSKDTWQGREEAKTRAEGGTT
jgi:hypothetical protein